MGCGASLPESAQFSLQTQSAGFDAATTELHLRHRSRQGSSAELTFTSRADFTMRDIIGKGGKSVGVQVAFHHASQRYYAIKFINAERAEEEHWEVQPLDEMRIMRELTNAKSPFITPLRGWFDDNGTIALVMSYMAGGELFSRLQGRRMCHDETLFYAAEIVLGLEAIHALGYIYRDLKPENVLLDELGHAHICDLGFAIKTPKAYRRLGTPQFQAPEMISPDLAQKGYTSAVDWWALGCMMYEMLVGQPAFGGINSPEGVVFAAVSHHAAHPGDLRWPRGIAKDARDIIASLLEGEPVKRLASAAAVKAHPFFRAVDWQAMKELRYTAPWIPPPMRFPGDVTNFDIYLRMEGETVVSRGAASRFIHEKPLPSFYNLGLRRGSKRSSHDLGGGEGGGGAPTHESGATAASAPPPLPSSGAEPGRRSSSQRDVSAAPLPRMPSPARCASPDSSSSSTAGSASGATTTMPSRRCDAEGITVEMDAPARPLADGRAPMGPQAAMPHFHGADAHVAPYAAGLPAPRSRNSSSATKQPMLLGTLPAIHETRSSSSLLSIDSDEPPSSRQQSSPVVRPGDAGEARLCDNVAAHAADIDSPQVELTDGEHCDEGQSSEPDDVAAVLMTHAAGPDATAPAEKPVGATLLPPLSDAATVTAGAAAQPSAAVQQLESAAVPAANGSTAPAAPTNTCSVAAGTDIVVSTSSVEVPAVAKSDEAREAARRIAASGN